MYEDRLIICLFSFQSYLYSMKSLQNRWIPATPPIRLFFFFFCLLVMQPGYGQQQAAKRVFLQFSDLHNLYRIDSLFYRSEQPDACGFKALEKVGVREVINLRAWHSDKDSAAGTGLLLHHIPMYAFWLSEEKLVDVLRVIKDRKGPVLVHCYHGSDRTGMVVALYRMVFQGVSKEKAIAEMHEEQFGHHQVFFNITRMLEKIDVEKIRRELDILINR